MATLEESIVSVVSGVVSEGKDEVEQIDELSKETLSSYKDKAFKSQKSLGKKVSYYKAMAKRDAANAKDTASQPPYHLKSDSPAQRKENIRLQNATARDERASARKHAKIASTLQKKRTKRQMGIDTAADKIVRFNREGYSIDFDQITETQAMYLALCLDESDFSQLDELSKDTMLAYRDKAAMKARSLATRASRNKGLSKRYARHADEYDTSDIGDSKFRSKMKKIHRAGSKKAYSKYLYDREKLSKRKEGIARATNRLTKEEVLDELSRKTLGAYIKKVTKRVEDDAYDDGTVYAAARDDNHDEKDIKRRKGRIRAIDKLMK